jgi:hypothetical protein
MTSAERTAAVEAHGFTPRQASFLTTVMLHGGVCVQRQYRTFAGIAHGQVSHNFFQHLTTRKFATAYPCTRAGSQVFHVHHKALYRAIGEPDSRNRRPRSLARAIEHLMVLDTVLAKPEFTWLAAEREKVSHFARERQLGDADLPALTFQSGDRVTVRYFPHKLPIGVNADADNTTFVYLVTEPSGRAFRTFVEDHYSLFRRLLRWRILLVLPKTMAMAEATHRRVIEELWAPPLRQSVVDELQWFCHTRRLLEEQRPGHSAIDAVRFSRARRAFGAPRFYAAYRRWLHEGDSSLQALMSPAFHDAAVRGAVGLETFTLPHSYAQLSLVIRTA